MDIRNQLEHLNLIPVSNASLNESAIAEASKETPILLVCDVSGSLDDNNRREYLKALAAAEVIEEGNIEPIMEDGSFQIIVPFHTLEVAEEIYRKINHATRFVKMYVDGRLQVEC